MPSKLVIAREKSALAVASAATTHAASAAAQFYDQFTPYLQAGESMPDVEFVIRLVGRAITQTSENLTGADKAHELELADDVEYRTMRDDSTGDVRSVLVDLRAYVSAGYGQAGLVKLGLPDNTPVDASALLAYGRSVLAELRNVEVVLPEPRRAALALDRESFAQDLEGALTRLDEARTHVARESREAEATLLAKHNAMERYDRVFSRGAGLLSAIFSASSLEQLAARVRPSTRRLGRTVADVNNVSEPEAPQDNDDTV